MKKSFAIIALAALVMLAGCKKNDPKPNGTRLIAGIEKHKSDSKTSLDGTIIKWSESDKLYVNNGTTPATFTLVSGAGTTTGEFATTGEYTFAAENNVAVYPNNYVNGLDNTTVTMTLPAVQAASGAGSFGNGANPMMGTFSDMDNLTLTSLCGVLCLQLTGDNVAITAIEIVGGPDDKLNGTFTVDYTSATPALAKSGDDGTNTVRLNFTETVTLTSTAHKFYVVVPAGTLHGFTMKVYDDDNNEIFSKSTANEVPVFVNTLSTMVPVEVVPFNPLATPLTFEARTAGASVGINNTSGINLEYSRNGGAWTDYTGAITLENKGDIVQFRGNNTSFNQNSSVHTFTCTGNCYIYGNIMSLLHAEEYATNYTLPEYAFYRLFYNNYWVDIHPDKELVLPATQLANYCYKGMFQGSGLTKVPALPATQLASYCYQNMFTNCQSLTTVPNDLLPATQLAYACYHYMFYQCSSLTEAPALPATGLADFCCQYMFAECTNLATVHKLPATTLAISCYSYMFYNCVSLETVPDDLLPATTLANGCYNTMFRGCTNLTTAPELPAFELVYLCYSGMFRGCQNLNSVTCLATSGFDAGLCLSNWMNSVASSGTFTKASTATWPTGPSGIPSGWTVATDGPAETTITWTSTFINSVSIMPWGHDSGVSASDGGITATFTENAGLSSSGITIGNSSAYGITFSTTTGNISKIEIYGTDNSANGLPSGWSYDETETKVTWQGTSAPSVTMNGVNAGPGEDVHIDYISQIVFTVQQ